MSSKVVPTWELFCQLPKFIMELESMTPADKLVYMALYDASRKGTGYAYARKRTMAIATGISLRQVRLSTEVAERLGLITEVFPKRRRKSRTYSVLPLQKAYELLENEPIKKTGLWRHLYLNPKPLIGKCETHTKLRRVIDSTLREWYGVFKTAQPTDGIGNAKSALLSIFSEISARTCDE